jgi:hypothetical protein
MSSRLGSPARLIWSLAASGLGTTLTSNGNSGGWPTPPITPAIQNAMTPVDLRDVEDLWLTALCTSHAGTIPSLVILVNSSTARERLATRLPRCHQQRRRSRRQTTLDRQARCRSEQLRRPPGLVSDRLVGDRCRGDVHTEYVLCVDGEVGGVQRARNGQFCILPGHGFEWIPRASVRDAAVADDLPVAGF